MKLVFTGLLTLLFSSALADTTVTVEILDVSRAEGHMVLTVFEGKKNWLRRDRLQEKVAVDGQETVIFSIELPPGEYGFQAYQDLDDNGKMKSNFIGIPREPVAVSNNAKSRFGPPKYKDAKVVVEDTPITVSMNLTQID